MKCPGFAKIFGWIVPLALPMVPRAEVVGVGMCWYLLGLCYRESSLPSRKKTSKNALKILWATMTAHGNLPEGRRAPCEGPGHVEQ